MSDQNWSESDIKQLPPPKTWDDLLNSRYLHSADLRRMKPDGKLWTFKVTEVLAELMPDEKHPGEEKITGTLRLEGEKKLLGLNSTNRLCLQAMFGREVAGIIGKRVTFKIDRVMAPDPSGEKKRLEVDAIRVAGSPDIEKDVRFKLKLPRKRPVEVILQRMASKGAGQAQGAPAAPPPGPKPSESGGNEPPPPGDPFA